jgi:EAL domain-containing protein (putative c-di-GMP-specific phosphodiesterase class I)
MARLPAAPPARSVVPRPLVPAPTVMRVLRLARTHLGMDLALLAAFTEDDEMVGVLDGKAVTPALRREKELPVDRRRCELLLDGKVPALVADASRQRPRTSLGPGVAAYVAAPVQLPGGTTFGILCCLARGRRPSLDDGSLRVIRLLAELAAQAISQDDLTLQKRLEMTESTLGAIRDDGIRMVFQPVFRLQTGETVGFEALARFPSEVRRPPRSWFWVARQVGLAVDLEVTALRKALQFLDRIPEPLYLSVNLFSETLLSMDLTGVFRDVPPGRVVLELAEHERLADSRSLIESVDRLRRLGARFAVDDAGSGFSSLRHVLRIQPELLKLDINLTHQVDRDPMQKMLVSSLASFAAEAGMVPSAEGIESGPQLEALREIGVVYGQGHLLGRPEPVPRIPSGSTRLPWARDPAKIS